MNGPIFQIVVKVKSYLLASVGFEMDWFLNFFAKNERMYQTIMYALIAVHGVEFSATSAVGSDQ